jgi:PTS system ascorbate-specific IIC component
MVSTAILMTLFFSVILLMLGRDYLVSKNFLGQNASFLFYVITTSFNFAVYLAILQLGVRTFVTELTQSFQGISRVWLPGAVPGVDCAVAYGFGAPNAVTIGFLFGALGQFISIGLLLAFKSPVVIIAGFVPMFFDNATIGVYANNKGGIRAAIIFPFLCGICQVFGSAFIASFIGLAQYGGYLGMWDWAVLWPAFTILMKYLGYAGYALVVIFLIVIPQLQYRKEKESYFLVTEDYKAYKAKTGI